MAAKKVLNRETILLKVIFYYLTGCCIRIDVFSGAKEAIDIIKVKYV